MLPLQIPADLHNVGTMSKGKLKLTFITQELVPHEIKARFLELHEETGWLSFLAGEKNITAEMVVDLPTIEKSEEENKSPAQRLRASLYILWEQKGKPTTFEEYYRTQMEKIINAVKERLV